MMLYTTRVIISGARACLPVQHKTRIMFPRRRKEKRKNLFYAIYDSDPPGERQKPKYRKYDTYARK